MPRLTTEFFVAAYVRRRNDGGRFTAVTRRGAAEAGAVFVKVARLDGTADLYGPAPQAALGDVDPAVAGGRVFERLAERLSESEVDRRLAGETRFDPDCWIVESEDRDGDHGLDLIGN